MYLKKKKEEEEVTEKQGGREKRGKGEGWESWTSFTFQQELLC